MDETTLQVLKEKGRSPNTKSYMWVMRGGTSEKPAVYFHYSPTRASSVAVDLLKSYRGVVQTDGYVGYDFIDPSPNMEHTGCWAHSRRKFMEILKIKGKYHTKLDMLIRLSTSSVNCMRSSIKPTKNNCPLSKRPQSVRNKPNP